jgi:hypothetical protein
LSCKAFPSFASCQGNFEQEHKNQQGHKPEFINSHKKTIIRQTLQSFYADQKVLKNKDTSLAALASPSA